MENLSVYTHTGREVATVKGFDKSSRLRAVRAKAWAELKRRHPDWADDKIDLLIDNATKSIIQPAI